AQRTQIALLHRVFRVGRIAKQIARQGVDVVEKGQRGIAKTPRLVMRSVASVTRRHVVPAFPRRAWPNLSASTEHHGSALLPVAASTTTVPVMCGCREQK